MYPESSLGGDKEFASWVGWGGDDPSISKPWISTISHPDSTTLIACGRMWIWPVLVESCGFGPECEKEKVEESRI